jgi:hypothetical protein
LLLLFIPDLVHDFVVREINHWLDEFARFPTRMQIADNPIEERLVALLDAHVCVGAGCVRTRDARLCCWLLLMQASKPALFAFDGYVHLLVM